MRNVWIDVDTQHDFCDPSGALFVRGADTKIALFRSLIERAVAANEPIVGSVDTHAFDAWEFAGAPSKGPNGETPNFPPHCVKGTAGQLKVAGTLAPRVRFIPNVEVASGPLHELVTKNAPQQILVEKEVYSLFANPNADAILSLVTRADEAVRYVVFGVALDYCVKAAALGLVDYLARTQRKGEVWLLVDATASVDEAGGDRALEACKLAGVRLAKVSDLDATTLGVHGPRSSPSNRAVGISLRGPHHRGLHEGDDRHRTNGSRDGSEAVLDPARSVDVRPARTSAR